MNIEGITIGQIIAAGAVLMALWNIIKWVYNYFVKPGEDVTKDILSIKKDISDIKGKLEQDYKVLNDHEKALNDLARRVIQQEDDSNDIHNALRVILVAEQAVTKSLLEDGNNKEGLRKAQEELNNYLRSKI